MQFTAIKNMQIQNKYQKYILYLNFVFTFMILRNDLNLLPLTGMLLQSAL